MSEKFVTKVRDVEPNLIPDARVAEMLVIHVRTLAQWRYVGRHKHDLPHIKFGRAVRYRESDVRAFIAKNQVGGTLDDAHVVKTVQASSVPLPRALAEI